MSEDRVFGLGDWQGEWREMKANVLVDQLRQLATQRSLWVDACSGIADPSWEAQLSAEARVWRYVADHAEDIVRAALADDGREDDHG